MVSDVKNIDDEKKEKLDSTALKSISRGSTVHPKVFLSYAWSDPEHKERVRLFADRLLAKGVDVILDIYDNKPGHELNHFMEQAVTDSAVTHVLIITDETYTVKADARKGGVGTETQLISHEVYKKIDQTKVVPLVFERDQDGQPYLPTYMKSRHYIDFTDDSQFDVNFDELIRHIYGQPKYVKPNLGPAPSFVGTEMHVSQKVPKRSSARTSFEGQRMGSQTVVEEFLDSLEILRKVSNNDVPVDEKVIKGIELMQPYTNALLNELDDLLVYDQPDDKRLVEKIDKLLTSAKAKQAPLPGVSSWRESDYESVGFVVHELATSIVALLVKHRRFSAVHSLINRTYFYKSHLGELRAVTFVDFYQYMRTLDDYRNSRLSLSRASVAADIQKENGAKFARINFEELRNADSLLYLLTRFNFPDNKYEWWFPRLSAYSQRSETVDPLGELISKSRADEIAALFGRKNVEELQKAHAEALEITSKIDYRPSWNFNVPTFGKMLPVQIANLP